MASSKTKLRAKRTASLSRKTAETDISMELNLDGTGKADLSAGIPFFEHMLDHVCRHGLLDMQLQLQGDLEIDCHHSVEDAAIVFGRLLREALGDKAGIFRYGHFTLPMDEVLVGVAVDLGGRYHFSSRGSDVINEGKFGIYDAELTLEFLRKLAMNAAMNLHVVLHTGENRHHIHEGIFKALGRALRMAVQIDPGRSGQIASTKGLLE